MKPSRRPESPREELPTAFTPILRQLWQSSPEVWVAAVADMEGECVDYVTSLDPYEAKVNAAHGRVLVAGAEQEAPGSWGELQIVEIRGEVRELWARRIDEEYTLVLVFGIGAHRLSLQRAVRRAVEQFRSEAGMATPTWEPASLPLYVELREARGLPHAPVAYALEGERIEVAHVLGWWPERERGPSSERLCFRVHTESGEELTLVHDVVRDGWSIRD